jgi:hypothetical protein
MALNLRKGVNMCMADKLENQAKALLDRLRKEPYSKENMALRRALVTWLEGRD